MSAERLTDEEAERMYLESPVGTKEFTAANCCPVIPCKHALGALARLAYSRGLQQAAEIVTRLADGRGIKGHNKRHAGPGRKWTTSAKKHKAAEMALRQAVALLDRERGGGDDK